MSNRFKLITGTVIRVTEQAYASQSLHVTAPYKIGNTWRPGKIDSKTHHHKYCNVIVDFNGRHEAFTFDYFLDVAEGSQVTLTYDNDVLISFMNDNSGNGVWMIENTVGYSNESGNVNIGYIYNIFNVSSLFNNAKNAIVFTIIPAFIYFILTLTENVSHNSLKWLAITTITLYVLAGLGGLVSKITPSVLKQIGVFRIGLTIMTPVIAVGCILMAFIFKSVWILLIGHVLMTVCQIPFEAKFKELSTGVSGELRQATNAHYAS